MEPWFDAFSPCPLRIVDNAGGDFGMGALGGGNYFVKGFYKSPKGERLIGGAEAFRLSSPRLGAYFAAWAATVTASECTSAYVRDKEDPSAYTY
ncbi:hypothetical protein MKX01_026454 [Papaver californicum]|nr:hypothetical protein MKX01_026454 [Papaver californicum]